MSELKLISVEASYNYAEPGDTIYITTKWQNMGRKPDSNAQIAADLIFAGRQRRDETQIDNFRLLWTPFPNTNQWKTGDIWSTTGMWKIPATWGGTFNLNISLMTENGEPIEFFGENGEKTFCQKVAEIDIAWGYGRDSMIKQRKPINVVINPICNIEAVEDVIKPISMGDFVFSGRYPAILGYKWEKWNDFAPILIMRRVKDNRQYTFVGETNTRYSVTQKDNKLTYILCNDFCNFDIEFTLEDDCLEVNLNRISVIDGYELISYEIPSLVQMSDEETVFTNFYGGGRIAKLATALPQSENFYYDTCNLIAASCKIGSFCLEAEDVENILTQSVIKNGENQKAVVLSATIRVSIPANAPNLMSIPVELKPLKMHFTQENNWKFAADIIKNKLSGSYPVLYKDTLLYKILLDASGQYTKDNPARWQYEKINTLADAKKIIMDMYHLSNGMHQVVYLAGWQTGGHDFSYPYPYKLPFNSRCGTIEEFNALREELKAYNVDLSLHDNFDDAYFSSEYEISEDILCFDECGMPWKGWMWAGGMSYIIDPASYLKSGEAEERVNAVIDNYGIENTYHLDVLTSEVRRYSFKPNKTLTAQQGIDAKIKILEAFNKKGIDVTSETLALPFVGKIGYSQNTRYRFGSSLFYGDEVAPLTTIGFHGITPYKVSSNGSKDALLKTVALGGSCCIEVEIDYRIDVNARNLYLASIPMSKLAYSRVKDAKIEGSKWEIEYQDGKVTADFETLDYTIEINGTVVTENYTTFMPLNENEYCYFSMEQKTAEIVLPKAVKKVNVYELCENGVSREFTLNRAEGFKFEAKADAPYIIKRVD